MGKETALPKNIRQIGDVQGREKICLEDYVATYIRKKEQQEEQGYLGIFLGERQKTEDSVYVFIRGILEVPREGAEETKRKENSRSASGEADTQVVLEGKEQKEKRQSLFGGKNQKENSRSAFGEADTQAVSEGKEQKEKRQSLFGGKNQKENSRNVSGEADTQVVLEGKEQKEKRQSLFGGKNQQENSRNVSGEADNQAVLEVKEQKNGSGNASETGVWEGKERKNGSGNASEAEAQEEKKGLSRWELLERERQTYFPDWEVQGCCVIGTYPTRRMEELAAVLPESGRMIYHLQEQEESIYWTEENQYRKIRGYFVFYEQNRRMQEYLAEVFKDDRVEKESQPDRAIKSFREKVKEKGQRQSGSLLKMASSFFVITVLVIGVIAVNRIEDIRAIRTATEGLGSVAENEVENEAWAEAEPAGADTWDADQELPGSDSFWEDTSSDTEDAAVSSQNLESAYDALSGAVSGQNTAASAGASSDTAAANTATAQGTTSGQNTAASAGASTETAAANTASTQGTTSGQNTAAGVGASAETAAANTATAQGMTSGQNTAASGASAETAAANTAAAQDTISDTASSTAAQDTASDTASSYASAQDVTSDAAASSDGEAVQEAALRQIRASYVIREGDTLANICNKYYGSLDKLQELCAENNITDADMILPGQKIVLP